MAKMGYLFGAQGGTSATEGLKAGVALQAKKKVSAVALASSTIGVNSAIAAIDAHVRAGDGLFGDVASLSSLVSLGQKHGLSKGMIALADPDGMLQLARPSCARENFSATPVKDGVSAAALEDLKESLSGAGAKIAEWFKKFIQFLKNLYQKVVNSNGRIRSQLADVQGKLEEAKSKINAAKNFDEVVKTVNVKAIRQANAINLRNSLATGDAEIFGADGELPKEYQLADGNLYALGYTNADVIIGLIKQCISLIDTDAKKLKTDLAEAEKTTNQLIKESSKFFANNDEEKKKVVEQHREKLKATAARIGNLQKGIRHLASSTVQAANGMLSAVKQAA